MKLSQPLNGHARSGTSASTGASASASISAADLAASPKLARALSRERMKRQLVQERVARRMLESCTYATEDGRTYVNPRSVAEPPQPGEHVTLTGGGGLNAGRSMPFSSLAELAVIRDAARYLADENMYTCGLLGVLESYIVSTGYSYRVVARERHEVPPDALIAGQDVIDEFIDRSHWWEWEKELFRRGRRDGEEARRYFVSDGLTTFRPIEPEHIVDPPGLRPDDPEWTMGVRRNADDPYTLLSYWVSYNGKPEKGVEVLATEIDHHKSNVDMCIPRGLSDFFCVKEIAVDLLKLIMNVNRTTQVLAAIAWIEHQAPGVLRGEIETMAANEADYSQTNPYTGGTIYQQQLRPGSKIRTNAGKQYNPAPLAQNTMNIVEIVRLARQALGTRWSAHEILTGDASNGNYASMLVAESPFVHRAVSGQQAFGNANRQTMLRVLRNAEAGGRLPAGFCANIDVQVEPPPITSRNALVESQADEVDQRMGIVSPQTLADRRGYSWEREQQQIQKAIAAGWVPPAGAGVATGGAGTGGFGAGLGGGFTESARDPFAWIRQLED